MKLVASRFVPPGGSPSNDMHSPAVFPAGFVARTTIALQLADGTSVDALLARGAR